MSNNIQPFMVDAHGSQVGCEWEKWMRNFKYFLDVNASARKHKLLLLFAGEQVQETADNLNEPVNQPDAQLGAPAPIADVFKSMVDKLDYYFAVRRNVTYERHVFRHMKQDTGEPLEKFAIRLRIQGKKCGYKEQLNENIRDQLIEKCISNDFRCKMLKKKDPTLEKILQ